MRNRRQNNAIWLSRNLLSRNQATTNDRRMPGLRKIDGGHVALDASHLSVARRGGGAGPVAVACHSPGVRPPVAAAVLLFQSGRCRQSDNHLVLERRELET